MSKAHYLTRKRMVRYIPNVVINTLTNSLKKGDFILYIFLLLSVPDLSMGSESCLVFCLYHTVDTPAMLFRK